MIRFLGTNLLDLGEQALSLTKKERKKEDDGALGVQEKGKRHTTKK